MLRCVLCIPIAMSIMSDTSFEITMARYSYQVTFTTSPALHTVPSLGLKILGDQTSLFVNISLLSTISSLGSADPATKIRLASPKISNNSVFVYMERAIFAIISALVGSLTRLAFIVVND